MPRGLTPPLGAPNHPRGSPSGHSRQAGARTARARTQPGRPASTRPTHSQLAHGLARRTRLHAPAGTAHDAAQDSAGGSLAAWHTLASPRARRASGRLATRRTQLQARHCQPSSQYTLQQTPATRYRLHAAHRQALADRHRLATCQLSRKASVTRHYGKTHSGSRGYAEQLSYLPVSQVPCYIHVNKVRCKTLLERFRRCQEN